MVLILKSTPADRKRFKEKKSVRLAILVTECCDMRLIEAVVAETHEYVGLAYARVADN